VSASLLLPSVIFVAATASQNIAEHQTIFLMFSIKDEVFVSLGSSFPLRSRHGSCFIGSLVITPDVS